MLSNEEKIVLLEKMLELEDGELTEETVLEDLDCWDSMAAIELIALVDEKSGKALTGQQIKQFKTVKDILDFMG